MRGYLGKEKAQKRADHYHEHDRRVYDGSGALHPAVNVIMLVNGQLPANGE